MPVSRGGRHRLGIRRGVARRRGGALRGSDKRDNLVRFGVPLCDGAEVRLERARVGWLAERNRRRAAGSGAEDDLGAAGVAFPAGEATGSLFCCPVVGRFVIGGVPCHDIPVLASFLAQGTLDDTAYKLHQRQINPFHSNYRASPLLPSSLGI